MNGFRSGLAAFAVIHVGVHWAFRRPPAYEFSNLSSCLLIGFVGGLGGIYLTASVLRSDQNAREALPGPGCWQGSRSVQNDVVP